MPQRVIHRLGSRKWTPVTGIDTIKQKLDTIKHYSNQIIVADASKIICITTNDKT